MRHLTRVTRLVAALAVAPVLALTAAPTAAATQPSNRSDTLHDAVVAKAHARATGAATAWTDARVGVIRAQSGWVLGMATLVAPRGSDAYPDSRLFLAERRNGSWEVGLDGEPAFAAISARAPMLSAHEREVFASHGGNVGTAANGDYRTGMRLPYGVGQEWRLSGGPHAWDAGSGPWSSIDLAGGDGRVLAVRAGTAYENPGCRGEIVIAHDRGYTTKYYHLVNRTVPPSVSVGVGHYLGNIGTAIPCGGAASYPHVHFTLMQHGQYVNIAYHIIGKWVFINGPQQYSGGYALHGSKVAAAGSGLMNNYGALGFDSGIVDANGGGWVYRRTGPGTSYSVAGQVTDGSTVKISCSRNGTTHTGRWGATALWNKLTDGTWVSDAFVYTGVDGPVSGWC
ncbi:MAG TPA: peptidoglycan DD-metalloendopeptidase family protein [Micromonosporaceae bacterium]|nr:peptidoglycan DD-metalloendopeptidase family protein [Micromonosporaceae bacterium]